jgi:hypothetical protein
MKLLRLTKAALILAVVLSLAVILQWLWLCQKGYCQG